MSQDAKQLVRDGLLFSGLFLLLLLIPALQILTVWFLPLPFFLLRVKQEAAAMAVPVIAIGLIFYFFPVPALALFFLFSFVVGSVMGTLYRRDGTTGTDVALGGLAAGVVASWGVLAGGQFAYHALDVLQRAWEKEWLLTTRVMNTAGVTAGQVPPPPVELLVLFGLLFFLIPVVLLNLTAARFILTRWGFPGKFLPPFYEWRLPRPFFHAYLLALLADLLLSVNTTEGWNVWVSGLIWMLQGLFTIQGLAFIRFVLHHRNKHGAWLLAPLFLLFTPLAFLLALVGCIDTGTRLRDQIARKRKEE